MFYNNDVHNLVKKWSEDAINEINKNGYISGGKNGPYDDNETPLRVSSHWIKIFSWLYKNEKEEKILNYIKVLADYIYKQAIYIDEDIVTFCSRNKNGKDHVNGTIGNAWIIEGLVAASEILKDDLYYDLAVKVFLSFPFNEKIGIWNRYEIEGSILGYDETFNHQLWLAASGVKIIDYKNNDLINKRINIFLNKIYKNKLYRIHTNGVIKHFSYIDDSLRHKVGFLKNHLFKDYSKKYSLKYKEEGYHYFALYGLAILKQKFPNKKIFSSKKIKKSIMYSLDKKNYLKQFSRDSNEDGTGLAKKVSPKTKINIYCFPYNSPAFELPFIYKIFNNREMDEEEFKELWEYQINVMCDNNGMSNSINDFQTLKARIYELLYY